MLGYVVVSVGFFSYLLVVIIIFAKRWKEAVAEAKAYEQKEKALKKE